MATGLLRLVVGAGLVRFRRFIARLSGTGDEVLISRIVMGLGVRDILVGVVSLSASRPGGNVARALAVQGAADTGDAALIAGLAAQGRLPRERAALGIGVAGASALAEYAAAYRLR